MAKKRVFTYEEGYEDGIQSGKDECIDLLNKLKEENTEKFEAGYDKAIDDIMQIIDEADDCANAMYLLGQFIIERKMKQ